MTVPEFDHEKMKLHWYEDLERALYLAGMIAGCMACGYRLRQWWRDGAMKMDLAARHLSYKLSLSFADILVLFAFAPAQLIWLTTFWWYGGDFLCRLHKWICGFSFTLTGNMQALIAFDRWQSFSRIVHRHQQARSQSVKLRLRLAWLLAFLTSMPQLYIFQLRDVSSNHTQCTSIILFDSNNIVLDIEHRNRTDFEFTNSTEYAILQARVNGLKLMERIYNAFHVITMVLIPFTAELIIYVAIMLLLRKVSQQADEIVRSRSMECSRLSNAGNSAECPHSEARALLPTDVEKPSSRRNSARRASKMAEAALKTEHQRVLDEACAVTRRKVVIMLTINLLFWLPYCTACLLHVAGGNMQEEMYSASALIVFNSIANIML